LRPLPEAPFEPCDKRPAKVSSTALVRYRMNYSVPTAYGFRDVLVKGFVDQVAIICGAELVGYRDGKYSVDGDMIRQVVDSVTTADPRYTPSNARRESRKLATQAMYEAWRKAYRDLKKKRRNMTDVWYSQQIAKQGIAANRSAETIRKHMKK
jgi:hypothetical protein